MAFFVAGLLVVGIIALFIVANDRARACSRRADSTGDNATAAHNGQIWPRHRDGGSADGDAAGDGGGD